MDYGTEVKLLEHTPNAEALIEWAGRLCYNTQEKTGTVPEWLQKRIKDGHGSLLEHATATFHIRCSRIVTHELVRHRIASYSQRSQRYVREDKPKYITPAEFFVHPKLGMVFREIMEDCWDAYLCLVTSGVKPEIARYVLPGACETQIVVTMNFRELLQVFIPLRTSPRTLPEMQEVAGKVKAICQEKWPIVFKIEGD